MRVTKFRDIRIGRSLKKDKAATNDKQGTEIGIERTGLSTGNEEQGSDAKEQQSENHTQAITTPVDKPTGGDGHDEVAEISRHLNER